MKKAAIPIGKVDVEDCSCQSSYRRCIRERRSDRGPNHRAEAEDRHRTAGAFFRRIRIRKRIAWAVRPPALVTPPAMPVPKDAGGRQDRSCHDRDRRSGIGKMKTRESRMHRPRRSCAGETRRQEPLSGGMTITLARNIPVADPADLIESRPERAPPFVKGDVDDRGVDNRHNPGPSHRGEGDEDDGTPPVCRARRSEAVRLPRDAMTCLRPNVRL